MKSLIIWLPTGQTNNYTRNQQNRNNDESDPFGNSSIDIDSQDLPF